MSDSAMGVFPDSISTSIELNSANYPFDSISNPFIPENHSRHSSLMNDPLSLSPFSEGYSLSEQETIELFPPGEQSDGSQRRSRRSPTTSQHQTSLSSQQTEDQLTGLRDSESVVGAPDISALARGQKLVIRGKKQVVRGTNGNDTIDASKGKGKNKLLGLGGKDTLIGGKGDRLDGGKGNDTLVVGKKGQKLQLKGGAGDDVFKIFNRRASKKTNTVMDFKVEGDRLWFKNAENVSISQNGNNTMVMVDGKAIAKLKKVSTDSLTSNNFTFVGGNPGNINIVSNENSGDSANIIPINNSGNTSNNESGGTTPTIQLVGTDTTASEPLLETDPGVFTVVRSGGDLSQPATVTYAIEGTAENGVDYETLSGTVVIPAGQTEAQISIDAIDDTLIEGDETVKITLQNSDGHVIDPAQNMATATIIDSAPTIPEQTETFGPPTLEQTSNNTWDMVLTGSDGSRLISTITSQESTVYVREVKFIPDSTSGDQGFIASFNPTGSRIDVLMDGDTIATTFELGNDDSLSITSNGSSIKIPCLTPSEEAEAYLAPNADNPGCAELSRFCNSVNKIEEKSGKLAAFTGLFAGTGIGAIATGVLGSVTLASKGINYACILMLGDDQDLAKKFTNDIGGEILGRVGGKLFQSTKDVFKKQAIQKLAGLGYTFAQYDPILNGIIGTSRALDTVKKLYDFTDVELGFTDAMLESLPSIPDSGRLEAIRRYFGIDFCDAQAPFFDASLSQTTIGYGSSATLTVEFINPNNDTTSVNISGSGLRGLGNYSFAVPEDLQGGGTLEFLVTNQGYAIGDGDCNDRNNNFLNVSVSGAGFEQIRPYNLTGGVSSFVFACSAIITPLF